MGVWRTHARHFEQQYTATLDAQTFPEYSDLGDIQGVPQ